MYMMANYLIINPETKTSCERGQPIFMIFCFSNHCFKASWHAMIEAANT